NGPGGISEFIDGYSCGKVTLLSKATDGFGPARPRSRGRGRRSGPAVCGKRQVNWIKRFSHFVKTSIAARFRRVESLFPSFDLLGRDIVTPVTINQNVGPDQREDHDGEKRTNENVAVISLVNLRLHSFAAVNQPSPLRLFRR